MMKYNCFFFFSFLILNLFSDQSFSQKNESLPGSDIPYCCCDYHHHHQCLGGDKKLCCSRPYYRQVVTNLGRCWFTSMSGDKYHDKCDSGSDSEISPTSTSAIKNEKK